MANDPVVDASLGALFDRAASGQAVSADMWSAYLRAFHEALPNANDLFLLLRTRADDTSYSVLAKAVSHGARRILDLASGDGNLVEALLVHGPPESRIDAIDASGSEIAIAQRRFAGEPRARFTTGDAARLPYEDASFDCVLAHQFLNFLPEIGPYLDEIVRVLKPGARLLFVANRGWQSDREAMWIKIDAAALELLRAHHPNFRWPTMGDMRIYREDGIREILAQHGGFDLATISIGSFTSAALLTPDRVAAVYNRLYVYGLAPEKKAILEAVRDRARALASRGDLVELTLPFRLVSVRKRP